MENKVMKAKAPEKLYVDVRDNLSDSILYGFTKKRKDDDIEYVRKDTFIEKVISFLENDVCCYIVAQDFAIEHERLEKDFRKYVEEEV